MDGDATCVGLRIEMSTNRHHPLAMGSVASNPQLIIGETCQHDPRGQKTRKVENIANLLCLYLYHLSAPQEE